MKQYITLVALLVAGSAFANASTLLGEWDFSSAAIGSDGAIAATAGDSGLSMVTYGQTLSDGALNFSPAAATDYAKIDVSSLAIGPCSGDTDDYNAFTLAITLTSFTIPSSGTSMLWSTAIDASASANNNNKYTTGVGVTPTLVSGMWAGSSSGRANSNTAQNLIGAASAEEPVVVVSIVSSEGFSLYINGVEQFSDANLKWSSGNLAEIFFGNWSSGQANAIATMSVSNVALYRGVFIPEPSAFGLLAGLGALALAGARRRKNA